MSIPSVLTACISSNHTAEHADTAHSLAPGRVGGVARSQVADVSGMRKRSDSHDALSEEKRSYAPGSASVAVSSPAPAPAPAHNKQIEQLLQLVEDLEVWAIMCRFNDFPVV